MFSKRRMTYIEVMSRYVVIDDIFVSPKLDPGQTVFRIGRSVYRIISQDAISVTCELIEHSGSFMAWPSK